MSTSRRWSEKPEKSEWYSVSLFKVEELNWLDLVRDAPKLSKRKQKLSAKVRKASVDTIIESCNRAYLIGYRSSYTTDIYLILVQVFLLHSPVLPVLCTFTHQ